MVSSQESEWDELIRVWHAVLARTSGADVPPPASAEEIRAAESRLGVTLPADLTDLYSRADGLPALGGDVYGVRGCAELMWFRDAEAQLIEIWADIDKDDGYLAPYLDLMRAGLAISKDGDEYRLLFVPSTGGDAGGWQLYQQSNGGDGVVAKPGSIAGRLLEMVNLYFE
jgi:cell wall assembly regulator SMI1